MKPWEQQCLLVLCLIILVSCELGMFHACCMLDVIGPVHEEKPVRQCMDDIKLWMVNKQ